MNRFKFEQSNADTGSHSSFVLLRTKKHDSEAIDNIDSKFYLMNAMLVREIPCEATLRQGMIDKKANALDALVLLSFLPVLNMNFLDSKKQF
jgi:hypothetical protein